MDYCFEKTSTEKHLAARFAGKEATIKAFCSLYNSILDFKNIEITNGKLGVPNVKINSDKNFKLETKISLSHTLDSAIAFVHLEGKDK